MEKKIENKETKELFGLLNTLNWKERWNPATMQDLRAIILSPKIAKSSHITELTDILVNGSLLPQRDAAGKLLGFFANKRPDLIAASDLQDVWHTASTNHDNESCKPSLVYLKKVVEAVTNMPPIQNFLEGAKELAQRTEKGPNANLAAQLLNAVQNKLAMK